MHIEIDKVCDMIKMHLNYGRNMSCVQVKERKCTCNNLIKYYEILIKLLYLFCKLNLDNITR